MIRRRSISALVALAALAGCASSAPSRADAVGALTGAAVPARFSDLALAADDLQIAVVDWCASGNSAAVLAQVAEVRDDWLALSPFWSGPVRERRSRFVIDSMVTPDAIDELAAGTQPVDAASLRDLAGADQRGLGAIAHLVGGEPNERSCEYVTGATDLIAEETQALADKWVAYGPTLGADDETANMAVRDMVSDALFAIRIAKDPPHEAGDDARVDGVRRLLLGDATAPGLAALLSNATVEQLTADVASGRVNEFERTIATNVVSDLGITVNFSDADGDG